MTHVWVVAWRGGGRCVGGRGCGRCGWFVFSQAIFTASHWFKKDPLGAQFGGAWLGRAGGRRSCGALESQSQTHGEEPAPPAGALQRGVGPGCAVWWRLLLVVAFVPDPSSLSSPGGNHP